MTSGIQKLNVHSIFQEHVCFLKQGVHLYFTVFTRGGFLTRKFSLYLKAILADCFLSRQREPFMFL